MHIRHIVTFKQSYRPTGIEQFIIYHRAPHRFETQLGGISECRLLLSENTSHHMKLIRLR